MQPKMWRHARYRRKTKKKDCPKKICINECCSHWKLQNQTQQWIVVCYTLNSGRTKKMQQQQTIRVSSFFCLPLSFCWLNIILLFCDCCWIRRKKKINKFSLFGRNYFFFCPALNLSPSPGVPPLNWMLFIFALLASGMNAINFSIHTYFIRIACIHAVFISRHQYVCACSVATTAAVANR